MPVVGQSLLFGGERLHPSGGQSYYGCMHPEPWLRGPLPGVHPMVAPILYAFQQAREDVGRFTEGLTPAQLWASPHGFGSAGFHIRHIAGSTGRL